MPNLKLRYYIRKHNLIKLVYFDKQNRLDYLLIIYSIGIAITVTEFRVGLFAFGLQNFKNMSNAQIANIPDKA